MVVTKSNFIEDKEYVIQKRFWKDNAYFDAQGIGAGTKKINDKWVPNRNYGWSDWEDLRGFHYFLAVDAALTSLNKHKHKLKRTVEFRIVRTLDINKATLEIQELCGIKTV